MSAMLMTDILEDERNFGLACFCSEQVVMIVLQLFVGEMVPSASKSAMILRGYMRHLRAGIAVKKGGRLGDLSSVLASLAFVCFVGIAQRAVVEHEQLAKGVYGEMSFGILHLVDHCGRKSLLLRLPLEDFLLYGTRRNETVYKACQLL